MREVRGPGQRLAATYQPGCLSASTLTVRKSEDTLTLFYHTVVVDLKLENSLVTMNNRFVYSRIINACTKFKIDRLEGYGFVDEQTYF